MLIADRYDPATHEMYEGPFTHFIRRELREENLFVYRHVKTENWIIAIWDPGKVGQTFREVICIGPSLTLADRPLMHKLRYVWRGPPQNILKRLKETERDQRRKLQDVSDDTDDAELWLAERQGTADHPYFPKNNRMHRVDRESGKTAYAVRAHYDDP